MAGYSLGGNLALKLAGEYGDAPPAGAACGRGGLADPRDQPVRPRARAAGQLPLPVEFRPRPEAPDAAEGPLLARPRSISPSSAAIRTVREFDDAYTAPHFGFRDAEDYYHRASAMRVIDRIRVPALIITAEDDPFVPAEPFRDPRVTGNPHITLRVSPHGGHCGFVGPAMAARTTATGPRTQIVEFVRRAGLSARRATNSNGGLLQCA